MQNCSYKNKEVFDAKQFAINNNTLQFGNFSVKKTYQYLDQFTFLHGKLLDIRARKGKRYINVFNIPNAKDLNIVQSFIKKALLRDANDTPSLKEDVDAILANFDAFYSLFQQKTNFETSFDIDETSIEQIQSYEAEKLRSDVTGNEQSSWKSADVNIRNLISTIPVIKEYKDGVPLLELNEIGLVKLINAPVFFNNLSAFASKALRSKNEFFSFLENPENILRFPELKTLVNLLPRKNTNINEEKVILNSIYHSLKKSDIPIHVVMERGTKTEPVFRQELAVKSNVSKIKDSWITYFNTMPLTDYLKEYIYEDEFGTRTIKSLPPFRPDTLDLLANILGFNLSPLTLEKDNKTAKATGLLKLIVKDVTKEINERNLRGEKFGNIFKELDSSSSKENLKKLFNYTQELLSYESLYTSDFASNSYKTADGETQYTQSEYNTLSKMIENINNATSLEKFLELAPYYNNNPIFKVSEIRTRLFSAEGVPTGEKLYLGNYNGFSSQINPTNNTSSKSSNTREKLRMDLLAFMNSKDGVIDIARTESSASFYFVRFKNKNIKYSFDDIGDTNAMIPLLRYLETEVDKKEFFIFKDVLPLDLQQQLLQDGTIPHNAAINQEINSYFNTRFEELKSGILNKYKYEDNEIKLRNDNSVEPFKDTQGKLTPSAEYQLRSFIATMFINTVELTSFTLGDLSKFKDFHKRFKTVVSTGRFWEIAEWEELTPTKEDDLSLNGAYKKWIDSEHLQNEEIKTYKTDVLSDKGTRRKSIHTSIIKQIEATGSTLSEKDLELFKKAYTDKIDISDGQGWMNLDAYKSFLTSVGRWTPEMDVAYEYEVLMFIKNKVGYFSPASLTPYQEERLQKLESLIYSKDANKYTLPPIKAIYSGPIENENNHIHGIDKFSLTPLTYSFVKDSESLSNLMLRQIKNNLAYSKYKSAAKGVVTHTNDINAKEVNNKQLPFDRHYKEFFKEQIKTTSSIKDVVIIGSQFRKLLFAGMFNNGEAVSPKAKLLHDRYTKLLKTLASNKKEKLNKSLGVTILENGQVTITDFTKINKKLKEAAISNDLPISIIDSLEVKEDGKLFNYYEATGVLPEATKLLAGLIDKELRLWKVLGNQYIQVSNAEFNPLEFYEFTNGNTKPAEVRISLQGEFLKLLNKTHPDGNPIGTLDRLNKLLKNKEWRKENEKSLRITGYRIPTQSHNSMEFLNIVQFFAPTTGNIIQLYDEITGKSGSDFDIDKMNIHTPILTQNGEYVDLQRINILKKDTKNLKLQLEESILTFLESEESEDAFSFEKLTLDARVDLFFSDLQLKFYKENDINQKELYTQEEIDNLPSIEKERELEKLRLINELEEKKKQIRKIIDNIKSNNEAINNSIYNEFNELYTEVLEQPQVFKQLVTPNNTEKVANDIIDVYEKLYSKKFDKSNPLPTGTKIYNYLDNLFVFDKLMVGRKHLGIYASSNVFKEISNILGLRMYNTILVDGNEIKLPLNFFSLAEQKRMISDNEVSLSSTKDLEGNSIQEVIDQLMTITLDAAKDPIYAYANINKHNINFVNLAISQGMPFRRVLKIINNPFVKMYTDARNANKLKKDVVTAILEDVDNLGTITGNYYGSISESQLDDNLTLTPKKTIVNKAIFLEFLKMLELSDSLVEFSLSFNQDTSKIQSPISATLNEDALYNLSRRFTLESADNFRENSLYSNFNNNEYITQLFKTTFPVVYTDDVINAVKTLISSNRMDVPTAEKKIMSHYMHSIVQTFGTYNNVNISAFGATLMSKDTTGKSYQNFLVQHNKISQTQEWKQLSQKNEFLNKLRVVDNDPIINIKLERDLKSNVIEVNIFNQEYTELLNNKEVSKELKNHLIKIAIIGMKQGLFFSEYYIADVIPESIKTGLISKAIQEYQKLSPTERTSFLDLFKYHYKINNPSEFKRLSRELKFANPNFKINKLYNIPYVKDNELTDSKKAQIQALITTPQNEVSDTSNSYTTSDIYSQLGNKTQSENVVIDEVNGRKPVVESNVNLKTFTNYSGAAQGGDTVWENVGKEFDLGKQVNYRPEDLQKLTKEQLQEVENAYQQAVKDLGRKPLATNTFAGGLVRRDYLQAKAADTIFAISTIVQPNEKDPKGYVNKTNKPLVAGGTGYAVQMAINLGKSVYVFDQIKKKWFVWNNNNFVETSTPTLTQKFAGIGTREINENGKQAIRDVYEKSIQSSKPIVAYRTRGNNFLEALEKDNAIGNPWSHLSSVQKESKVGDTVKLYWKKLDKSQNGKIISINSFDNGYEFETDYVIESSNGKQYLIQTGNGEVFALGTIKDGFVDDGSIDFGTLFIENLNPTKQDSKNQYGLYKTNTVKEAVKEFVSWMTGEKHTDKLQDYRQAIIDKLPELKNKQILYYKDLGEPSHATALDFLINKYDWNNTNKVSDTTLNNVETYKGFWKREDVAKQTDKIFLFGDNTDDRVNTKYIPSSTQAVIRGLQNAIGIDTKKNRGVNNSSYFTDSDFPQFKKQVDEAIQKAKDSGKTIVIPEDGIGTGKAMLKEKAPKLFEYLQQELNKLIKSSNPITSNTNTNVDNNTFESLTEFTQEQKDKLLTFFSSINNRTREENMTMINNRLKQNRENTIVGLTNNLKNCK